MFRSSFLRSPAGAYRRSQRLPVWSRGVPSQRSTITRLAVMVTIFLGF
jgi:hypothetical protein